MRLFAALKICRNVVFIVNLQFNLTTSQNRISMLKTKKPLILISNDDGYNCDGILALVTIARKFGNVVVVAPQIVQSGRSSAITFETPLRARKHCEEPGLTVWVVNGTPADCVKLALDQLLGGRIPDLALSGINHGLNMGVSVLYSGTMGAAFEACVHEIPSIAFSYGDARFNVPANGCLAIVENVIARTIEDGLPKGTCLNVNIPKTVFPLQGIKITTACMGRWVKEFERRIDPTGEKYYWMTGHYEPNDLNDDTTDVYWTDRGWVSVTPTRVDQTDHQSMEVISDLLL